MTINSTSPRSALATPYSSTYNTSMFHHKHAILLAGSNSLSIAQPRTDGTASCFIIQMTQRARQAPHYPTLNSALTTGSRLSHERALEKRSRRRYKHPCCRVPARGCGQGFQTQTLGQRQSPHKVDGSLDSGHSTLPAPPPGFLGECFQPRPAG